jgi:hypothetical protein
MGRLLVVGGFTESKRLLEPVADAAVKQQLGYDATVMTLSEARKTDEESLRRAMAGANVLTHSAGLLAVPDARKRVDDSELPNKLIVVAGPEPRKIPQLEGRALQKTFAHIFGETAHARNAHVGIVAGNIAELVAHPLINLSLATPISHFSTMKRLDSEQAAAVGQVASFMMKDDEYYANPDWLNYTVLQHLQSRGCIVDELPGRHDELLLAPSAVLGSIKTALTTTPVPAHS